MSNQVTAVPAAASLAAVAHFAAKAQFETDCSDVNAAFAAGEPGFVLLDVRNGSAYARGHVPGALNLPHVEITVERMAQWPLNTLFVVYCAGPHCNGADKGALKLAQLGRPVKLMIGGVTGWLDEGLPLHTGASQMDAISCAC
ncbi:Rhodanese-related sulfurtransferase [Andreprevotia lacus DSM 23236]|uniref:Rhodanese-related sulfurtransferase n=2 Tax=Andreprevotia TaxID=397275 RepID=A0A1W1Y0J9_9NEIS|nr:Rhodanese-related sulfurtransferase [Andreprevotia lacus DSM 23236]